MKKYTLEKNMVVIMFLTISNNSGVLKNGTITLLNGWLLYNFFYVSQKWKHCRIVVEQNVIKVIRPSFDIKKSFDMKKKVLTHPIRDKE